MSDVIRQFFGDSVAVDGMSPAARDMRPNFLPGLYDLFNRKGDDRDAPIYMIPHGQPSPPPSPGTPYYEQWHEWHPYKMRSA